jgi:hypothetical protein
MLRSIRRVRLLLFFVYENELSIVSFNYYLDIILFFVKIDIEAIVKNNSVVHHRLFFQFCD